MNILLLMPIILIGLGLIVFNLINLNNKKTVKYLSKTIWLVIILIGNIPGNVAYMILEGEKDEDSD